MLVIIIALIGSELKDRNKEVTNYTAEFEEEQTYEENDNNVTGVLPYKDREVSRLSGGQRQRVWIAMALAQDTKILLLDEPTTYLDIRYQIEILELVKRLNKEYGITIIMVLHDINQAIAYSDRIVGLKDGNVVIDGVPQEVINTDSINEIYGITLKVTNIEGNPFVLAI